MLWSTFITKYVYVTFIHVDPHVYFFFFTEEERHLQEELINSSWCGVLAALSLLLDARYVCSV